MKIWGKLIKGEKTVKSATVEVDEYESTFFQMTKAVCESLKCGTPVIVTKHVLDFKKFNFCAFKKDDFVENIDFDRFIMQNITNK